MIHPYPKPDPLIIEILKTELRVLKQNLPTSFSSFSDGELIQRIEDEILFHTKEINRLTEQISEIKKREDIRIKRIDSLTEYLKSIGEEVE